MKKQINIDIICDIICPWCYIGKARLERAIETVKGEIEVTVNMRPFLLYPHIPKGGVPKDHFSKLKKPGLGRVLREEAAKEAILIDYNKIERIPNTLEAHRLMYLCEDATQGSKLGKILFKNYFEEGKNIEDQAILIQAAEAVGISKSIIEQFTYTNDGEEEVQREIAALKENGVTAVPSFILNGEHLVVGAQPMENFQRYFSRLK